MIERYCEAILTDGSVCEELAYRKGLCPLHLKQQQRQRPFTPKAEKLNLEEKAIEAWSAYVEASSVDDREYERKRRAALASALELGQTKLSERVRRGLALAKRRGVRLGRPPKVDDDQVKRLLKQLGSIRAVAAKLGVSTSTVWARVHKTGISEHRRHVHTRGHD